MVAAFGAPLRFDIEGQEVECFLSGKERLWRCDCDRFKLNLTRFQQGFCPHVLLRIARALRDRVIDVDSLLPDDD